MLSAIDLQAILDGIAADFVKQLDLRIESVEAGQVTLAFPVSPRIVHAGGVVCGQAIMAVADTAMLVALIAALGEFRPMTTVQLQASFLRPISKDANSIVVKARILRQGKALSYGEVEFIAPDGRLSAHATTTYSLL